MSSRPISPMKRPNSENLWFRMIVPPDLRQAVGKREIRESLHTPKMSEARLLCSTKQLEWNERFAKLREQNAVTAAAEGVQIVDRLLDARIAEHGIFHAVAYELELIAQAECAHLDAAELIKPGQAAINLCRAYATYADPQVSGVISARQRVLHRDVMSASLAGTEAASRAHTAGFWQVTSTFLQDAFEAAGLPLDEADPRVYVAADHFLSRLLSYRLPQLDMAAIAHPIPTELRPAPCTASKGNVHMPDPEISHAAQGAKAASLDRGDKDLRRVVMGEHAEARTLLQVFSAWAASRQPEDSKLVDEWNTTINRFVELHDDLEVTQISKDHVTLFREAMKGLPSRPKAAVRCLPLRDQIEIARRDELPTLSGPTIAKHMSGLRSVLDHAVETLGLMDRNVAKDVKVTGSKSAIDARLAHTPEDLRVIFSSPMMTDSTDRLRTTDFWLVMMAPLMGIRIEEAGKLRPGNVKIDRGITYISIERDTLRKRRENHAKGEVAKRAKTKAGYRDIPVHWILIEAGFLEYVERKRAAGSEWLFDDLTANKHGDRTKAASQRIIRRLRALGITDSEKDFHSFRHDMKRAARGTGMKEEIADLLAGHAPDSVGRKYGAGAELTVLKEAVNMIDYELIEWDPVIKAARKRMA
ncbi:DUF6538 domain-containing protein [Pacificimonas flava]|uniref:Integrase n=1 Tax=Pacificimonas flava TaxID=1234595 RepID=M2U9I9_9SPHN|nr:DUF6538 domain-containing protein [Pacificimonas flava]EMD84627.1 Integrase [Pacificimonas flava]MBB5279505.1 integrase [Pacificimonas flava]